MDKDYTVPIGKAKVRNPTYLNSSALYFNSLIYYVLQALKLSARRMMQCAIIA